MQPFKTNFYYQPALMASISSWTWTTLLLVMGVIFWLEVTHFNWIAAAFFVIFIMVVLVQFLTRTLEIQDGELIVNRTLQKNWLLIPISDIKEVQTTKMGIKFIYNGTLHFFYLAKKDRQLVLQLLKTNHAEIVGD